MNLDDYAIEYIRYLFIIIGGLWCAKLVFSKKIIIDPEKAYPNKKEFVRKHIKAFNVAARIVLITVPILAIFIIPVGIKDLKNYINRDFKVIRCKTLSHSIEWDNLIRRRSIKVINIDTGEISIIVFYYKAIEVDEYYTIEYLPNMLVGKIISKDN
ncbi:MAG: hypothetical protein PHD15_00515 [Clostridia bacterium]|nr:hypothetical protein [Clostridia bacterium]MDD4386234.1 hypothetical protein [Clostridia bacterium]